MKIGSYTYYPPKLCAKISKFVAESGNKAAVENKYYEASKDNWMGEVIARLEHGLRGQPLKLGDRDSDV